MRFSYVTLIAAVLAMGYNSCSTKGGKYLKQGEIHYAIDYSGAIGSIPKEVLPQNLIVSFKDDKILFELLSPIGNSGILNLANPDMGIFDTYFNLFTIKYYYAAEPGELYPGFEAMEGIEIHKTDKTAIICGFNCKNAEITFPDDRGKTYQVWYTNEINVKNSNASTPYSDIEGVLMDFLFRTGHSELHFNAENVYRKEIPDELFERRAKYKRVSREDIIRFITTMLNF